MLVDWKYVYKRRGWTISLVVEGLAEKNWESFQEFHKTRGLQCPSKKEFDEALPSPTAVSKVAQPKKESKPPPAKKKRTYTRKKGVSSDRGKKAEK